MADTFLRTPVPNIPMVDAMGQVWSLATTDDGSGNQAINVIASVSAPSNQSTTFTNHGGTITVGGTSQVAVTADANTRFVIIQNPPDAASQGIATAENLFVAIGAAATVNGSGNFAVLAPGQSCVIGFDGYRPAAANTIRVNAATTGHIFYATDAHV